MDKRKLDCIKMINSTGLEVVSIDKGRHKHIKIRCLTPKGNKCLVVAPKSVSDNYRGLRNLRAECKRLITEKDNE